MNKILVSGIPAIVVLLLVGCGEQSAPPSVQSDNQAASTQQRAEKDRDASSDKLPEWSLSEADAESLGSPYKMSSFEIRPPANFDFIKFIPEAKTYYWVGPIRADETYPQFFVTFSEMSTRDANHSLAESMADVMERVKQRRTDWSQTPVEQGKINGQPFVKCSWAGIATSAARAGLSGRKMHGIIYLTIYNNELVQIMCQDVAPEHEESLKLGGCAALTFRVAPAENDSP